MVGRTPSSTSPPANRAGSIELTTSGDIALVNVVGLVDERFTGFGKLDNIKALVINTSGMTRMTSFGVRQWLRGMDALPKTITDLFLLGCPTFFVDQLNMVLNFGGNAQVLTVIAPYTCSSCGVESGETVDVLAERAALAKGGTPEKECSRCGAKLEFDETPESYFSFVTKYAASSLPPTVARLLAGKGLYAATDTASEKPPRIIKLVHGTVTYFRIIGTVGSMFRARPFLVGAEGEVVIDLAEVDRFETTGQHEWRRLLKSLSGQVPSITLVDANDSFLARASDSLTHARNISIWSVLVPFSCIDCGRVSAESQILQDAQWPIRFEEHICPTCGGSTRSDLSPNAMAPFQGNTTPTPTASAKLIRQRDEILSRALTDAAVAQAGEGATASLATDDTILGKYKIVRRLSAGGMAEVFLAKQVGIGGFEKPVALKRIQRQLLESRHLAIDMFLNEAKIAGRLMHPAIVQVLDVGEVGGALYLAMEYVNGKDLRQIVKKLKATNTSMPLGDICFVVREIAHALHHAYWSSDMAGNRLAVVHRDVSPHNVILSWDGAVKLLDFGVAMSAVTESSESMIVGKWLYMSPEHASHEQLDHRSDLFSLGVITYLLCTGVMPFEGTEPKEIVRNVRAGHFRPLKETASDLPEALTRIVDRMLSPDPADRPQTGREVAATLDEISRSYGIESSTASINQFLATLYGEERDITAPVELRTASQSINSAATSVAGSGSAPRRHTPSMPMDVSMSLPRREAPLPIAPTPVAPLPRAGTFEPPNVRQSSNLVILGLILVVAIIIGVLISAL